MSVFDIQREIDCRAEAGGGEVIVPPGDYHCGTIIMRSNISLHLSEGAVIYGSSDLADYPAASDNFSDGVKQERGRALVLCDHVENISISGGGEINGQGGCFSRDNEEIFSRRPMLIRFIGCRGVSLREIRMRAPAAWTCHLRDCEDVEICGIDIYSNVNSNNDGIDIDSCRRVTVKDCRVDSGDDGICLKSTMASPCENILIENCEIISRSAAFKVGTETYGDIRNVTFRNCRILRGNMGAIKLLSADGAVIEDFTISDVDVSGAANPLFIRLCRRCRCYNSKEPAKTAGAIRRINVKNLRAQIVPHPELITSANYLQGVPLTAHNALSIMGLPGDPVTDVKLENISLTLPGGLTDADSLMEVMEFPESYPELGYYGTLPAWGVYMRNAENVSFDNFSAENASPDIRQKVVLTEVKNISGITQE
jgi:polygalacturonase